MTQEELEAAAEKLIGEANEDSAAAKREYEKDCLSEKNRALSRRIFRSSILENILAVLKSDYEALVKKIQKELDESLAALYGEGDTGGEGGEGGEGGDAPYEVDYTLPMRDRYVIVKNYYLSYADPAQALADFEKDEIAKEYIGVYYEYLRQLLLMIQV